MGFEDTLMNFLEEPDAMHELIDYIKNWKLQQIGILIENLQPDVMNFHDDWGAKYNMFMKPETWREFFKAPYKEIYGLMKKHGVITMHHADSYCQPIAQDMVDVGIDIWEGVLPSNDIQQIKKDTGYKLTLMGGIDASVVDREDWTEEVVRAEVARACKEYHEGGMFIPCLTYGGEGSIYPGVNDCIMDEIRKQNKLYFK
jgi:uroporphyrinogen-III decarboxylase